MNLRIRDHLLLWAHRGLAKIGKIKPPALTQIQEMGFKRVLVVATTAIGDAVLCTPLIDSLKQSRPDAEIGFWVSEAAFPLFEGRRNITTVIPYHGKYRKVKKTLSLLRAGKYDVALIANANDPDIIPMVWWSGCKRILRRPQRNTIYSFMIANPEMLSHVHDSGHAIDRNLQFCDLLGLQRGDVRTLLDIRPNVFNEVQKWIHDIKKPIWIMHPGASIPRKQWSAENYSALADKILHHAQGTIILTGTYEELALCTAIRNQAFLKNRIVNFAGRLKLNSLAALIKSSKLFISGDTGPFHIAMAVGTPTVTLFAPWDIGSSSKINGPYFYKDLHIVLETEMNQPIMTISMDQVLEACKPFLTNA